jgi:hypothetical protein
MDYLLKSPEARSLGACIGHAIDYVIKYRLYER